jgi:hypothetical protein
MSLSEEIYARFFSKLREDSGFPKSLVNEIEKLVQAGQMNRLSLRTLIEETDSNGHKD